MRRDRAGGFEGQTATLARDAPSRPLAVVLRVLDAEQPPPPFVLESGRCVVGSAANADVVIRVPTVSRHHIELALVPEGVAVRDLGSRNGTFYLGQRVEKMVLSLGARLSLGDATLVIEPDPRALTDELEYTGDEYAGIVGTSRAMRRLFAKLTKLEGSLATVLISGESGVGKELVARALHRGSRVAAGPLVVVNCGAIARELVASELFGHKRGAFTGAVKDRLGAFEAANGGTLFLDEVGELPLEIQPMLLRALEVREFQPLGSHQLLRSDARVVAATNRDLERAVAEGRFREDLFYRLAVIEVPVPPLRERGGDIAPLAQYFAQQFGVGELPARVVAQLEARSWPGNVRELRNAVQVYGALGALPEGRRSRSASLQLALEEVVDFSQPYAELKSRLNDEFTRVYLKQLLLHTGGNQTEAARIAGLDRTYLGRLLQRLGVDK
jgi:transcriptional regulator with GAF, ATPase, and Fis domain